MPTSMASPRPYRCNQSPNGDGLKHMKRFLLTVGLWLSLTCSAWAQNPTCPTRPAGDSSNACSSTAFVQGAISGGGALSEPANTVFSGPTSGGNLPPTFRLLVPADLPATLSQRVKLPTGTTNFYSNSSATGCTGSVPCLDTNDGLTPGTAKKTVLGALYGILNGYDFTCNVVAQSTAQVNMLANEINAGQTLHYGPHDYPGACAGSSVIVDGAGFTFQYDSGSSAAIAPFFTVPFQLQNIALANSLGPCVALFEKASIRFGAGINFLNCGIGLQANAGSVTVFLNNFHTGTNTSQTAFIQGDENSRISLPAGLTITCTGSPTWIWTIVVQKGAIVNLNNPTWSGCGGVTAQKFLVTDGGAIINGAANIPGGTAGVTNSGGTSDGAAVAVTAGGTGLAVGVSGAVPYFSSTTTIAASALLTNHGPVVGGGSGAAPKTVPVGTTGQALLGVTGADPAFGSIKQIIPINNGTVALDQATTAFQVT